ncbi:MAG: copper chaperone PCu(A)C [Mesorhizobium sp.]|nr:copper chaperone PCu(A)C [Mesorhizobium sp.]
MRKTLVIAPILLLLAGLSPAASEENGEHVSRAGNIRIVHPWARAAKAGDNTLVFMEIENAADVDTLTGAASEAAAAARIIGITLKDGASATQEIGPIEIPKGDFDLDPGGVAIELVGLKSSLAKGHEIEVELRFETAGDVHLHVEVEAADATRHSHAGHAH